MKRGDELDRLQERANVLPLHADASAVDEAHLAKTRACASAR